MTMFTTGDKHTWYLMSVRAISRIILPAKSILNVKKKLNPANQLKAIPWHCFSWHYQNTSASVCQLKKKPQLVGKTNTPLSYSELAQALQCNSFHSVCMLSTGASEDTTALLPIGLIVGCLFGR